MLNFTQEKKSVRRFKIFLTCFCFLIAWILFMGVLYHGRKLEREIKMNNKTENFFKTDQLIEKISLLEAKGISLQTNSPALSLLKEQQTILQNKLEKKEPNLEIQKNTSLTYPNDIKALMLNIYNNTPTPEKDLATVKVVKPKPKINAPIPHGAKVVNGKYVCAKKDDKPHTSTKNPKWHMDMQCCLDPDEISNPHCSY